MPVGTGAPARGPSYQGIKIAAWDCRPECALEPCPGVAARFMAMAQPWAVHLGSGKGSVLAAATTPGHMAWGLGGKHRRMVFCFEEVAASDSIFYILG